MMANQRDVDHHNNDSGDDVNNPVLLRVEFLDFHDENQQFCDSTQHTSPNSGRTMMKRIVRTRRMQRDSLGIIVVLQRIIAKIIRRKGAIG